MVLLSIKPKFVDSIITGTKKFEFRKSIFKNKVDKIYIYASSPVKQIIGFFIIENIIKDHPNNLWKNYNQFAGIDKNEFFNYFSGKENGYAIQIGELELFDDPLNPYEIISNFTPPQSFYYFDQSLLENLNS